MQNPISILSTKTFLSDQKQALLDVDFANVKKKVFKINFFICLIVFFFGQLVYSQVFENIDRITFSYSIGGNAWENGIYSRNETFELVKNENGDFKFLKYLKINSIRRNEKFTKDTIVINTRNYSIIKKSEIQDFIKELNSNQENFTEKFLKQEFIKPTKKEILKIAKKSDDRDYFINDYDEKVDTEKKYLQIQEFKYLDEFLKINKQDMESTIVWLDAWNTLSIITYSKDGSTKYKLTFLENNGQPISIINEKIKDKEEKTINLKVNLITKKIAPKNSEISKIVDLNNIKLKYINWYLKNKTSEL